MSENNSDSSTANASSGRQLGRVKWFNNQKGFGFVTDNDENDVFVHHTALLTESDQFRYLVQDEWVEFEKSTMDNGKTVAVNVSGPNSSKLTCELRQLRKGEEQSNRGVPSVGNKRPSGRGRRRDAGPRGGMVVRGADGQEWQLVKQRGAKSNRKPSLNDSRSN